MAGDGVVHVHLDLDVLDPVEFPHVMLSARASRAFELGSVSVYRSEFGANESMASSRPFWVYVVRRFCGASFLFANGETYRLSSQRFRIRAGRPYF